MLAAGIGFTAVSAGFGATAIDQGPCSHGDQAACVGRDFGLVGAVVGAPAVIGDALVGLGALAEGSTAATLLDGAGALGWFLGGVGSMVDFGNAYQDRNGG